MSAEHMIWHEMDKERGDNQGPSHRGIFYEGHTMGRGGGTVLLRNIYKHTNGC